MTATMAETPARELLVDLVSQPSPSGDEAVCAERLVAFFESFDREAWIDEVGNVRAPADDSVLLTSHIDTVPGDIPVRVEDGVLWGRGSVDATGSLAAMAAAAVETGVSFAGVVCEETDSTGAWHLAETRDAPDAVVNGEPSGWDAVALGYRGILQGTYTVTTEGKHSSRPEPNAIQHASAWWSRIEGAFESNPDDAVFEQVTAKPIAFDGGLTDDGLSLEATVETQFRVPPGESAESVRETVEAELSEGNISWGKPIPPSMSSPRTAVARAFRNAIRREDGDPSLLRKTGTCDVSIYDAAWDCHTATYGPGDSDFDHAPDERLPLAEFDRSVAVLERVAETLAGDN